MQELFKINYNRISKIKRLPPRDQGHYLPFNSFPHGCPLGGFGAGTIGRSPWGDFNIWHIKVGAHIVEELKSCSFHAYQKINPKGTPKNNKEKQIHLNLLTARAYKTENLKQFAKPYDQSSGYYAAAYPKAKYVFNASDQPAEIICEQFSPILPNNYQETSYPVAVFEHTVRNKTNENIEVSLMFSWANMTGWQFEDCRPGVQDNWFSFVKTNLKQYNQVKEFRQGNKKLTAIVMSQNKTKIDTEMYGELAIATLTDKDMQVTFQEYFYLNGTGAELYQQFGQDGTLTNEPPVRMQEHQGVGSALAVKVKLKPGQTRKIPFVLVWDLPVVHFGPAVNRYKYYTRFFDRSGHNSLALAKAALVNYQEWSGLIDDWHQEIIINSKISPHLTNNKSRQNYFKMLINELYFLSDGGTYWDAESGNFGLLECFDYPFYETIDVRFYGSFPLLKFWPEIELKIMEEFCKTIDQSDSTIIRFNHYTDNPNFPLPAKADQKILFVDQKKRRGCCPHDLGSPKEEPFGKIAHYTWQNTNYWKDLNTKFVLLVFRDYYFTKNKNFLKKCWPAMKSAMAYLQKMDLDQDGIPENSGYPDQTYDNWVMHGVSAYCGTLWLAALQAMQSSAEILKLSVEQEKYKKLLIHSANSLEKKLWNNNYYNFCENNDDIMTDQLIGQWYVDLLGQADLLPEDNIQRSLRSILKYNFYGTAWGHWGVVSGKKRNHQPVDAEQGRDVWVGANFAICGLLMRHGLINHAEKILNALSRVIYDQGFFFRTPEGWDTHGHFTATMYMRPNAIWSLEF